MSDTVEDSRRTIMAIGKEKEEMEMLIGSLRERIRQEVIKWYSPSTATVLFVEKFVEKCGKRVICIIFFQI